MKRTKKTQRRRQHGSALLVSLMVMVGLSLLGLAFVAISETESAISVNERNYVQTLQVAEAGLRTVAEWFNAPQWALENGLMPANSGTTFKQERGNATYTGFYKSSSASILCDRPWSSDDGRFLAANRDSADLVFNDTTAATFMNTFNARLFNDNAEGGRIVEIRIYGPPVVGGTTTTYLGRQYWDNSVGTRYGIATIEVTAEKRHPLTNQILSRRTVRATVAELPVPGADGPLQSHSGTGATGNFRVHWGRAISNGLLKVKRINRGLPWLNAWDVIPYEEGYSASYDTALPQYLHEMINKQIEDPWFETRSRGDNTSDPPGGTPATSGTNQLWTYTSPNDNEVIDGYSGFSANFRFQNEDNKPINKKVVLFTRPVYSIWKQIALAGAGQQGIYYLRYVSGTGPDSRWRDIRGEVREWRDWVNIHRGGEEGFFFFDTTTGGDPQTAAGGTIGTILTPAMSISSAAGNPFKMRGFFYMNMVSWGTQGLNDPGTYYNMPGEPFRDIGVHVAGKVGTANAGKLLCDDPGGGATPVACDTVVGTPKPTLENYTNKQWDYQDLNENGRFDYQVTPTTSVITPPGTDSAPLPVGTFFIVPYSDGCGIAGVGITCSEPHEPYLNLVYPSGDAVLTAGGSPPNPVTVRWHAKPGDSTVRRPKKLSGGTPVTCDATSPESDCTSATYDDTGALVTLDGTGAILEGVIYNEGSYDAAGNAIYYGAILVQGTVTGAGTPWVFFDESLRTGKWADKFKNLPRTIMTSVETDQ